MCKSSPALSLYAALGALTFATCACAVKDESGSACAVTEWQQDSGDVALPLDKQTYDQLGQTFRIMSGSNDDTFAIVSADLKLLKTTNEFNEAEYLTLSIETDSSGGSSETYPLALVSATPASSATVLLNTMVAGSADIIKFTFPGAVTLTANKYYWVKLTATYPASTQNHVKWNGFRGQYNYPDGRAFYHVPNTPFTTFSNSAIGDLTDFFFSLSDC